MHFEALFVRRSFSEGGLITKTRTHHEPRLRWVKQTLLIMRWIRQLAEKSHRTNRKNIILAMKFTAILLTISCMQVAANGKAQTVTLDLKNAPVQKVFKE